MQRGKICDANIDLACPSSKCPIGNLKKIVKPFFFDNRKY